MLEIINVLRSPYVHLPLVGVLGYLLAMFVPSWPGIAVAMAAITLGYLVGVGVGMEMNQ